VEMWDERGRVECGFSNPQQLSGVKAQRETATYVLSSPTPAATLLTLYNDSSESEVIFYSTEKRTFFTLTLHCTAKK